MTCFGPENLGRGLVILPGAAVPEAFAGAPRVRIDDAALADPEAAADELHAAWVGRRRVVVELAVPAELLKEPESVSQAPYRLGPGFTFSRERLQFLVWANTYDGRRPGTSPVWWHGVRASRIGALLTPDGPADIRLSDGRAAFCDGGPRTPLPVGNGIALIHRDSIDAGRLTAVEPGPGLPAGAGPAALSTHQLAAVAHPGGPARIIAPAGSGKTRVLVERIRHLLVDRSHEPELTTAVAYNVLAAEQLRERTAGFTPTIRTLNSLGLAVCQRRRSWRLAEERQQREILSGLVRTRGQRRVGTDPLAPYLDALSAIRLGLLSPEHAEEVVPDAAGVAAAFPAYREALHDQGCIDYDDQIYLALELLLSDPDLRAEVRAGARTLLVDEFQDLTPAHLLLLRLIAGPASDVFGVGDDDQVIYGYAGADPGFLIDYTRYFPGAATYDLRVNYRCPPAIVGAARTLLTHNRRRVPKEILAASEASGEAPPPEDSLGAALLVERAATTDAGPATVAQVGRWAAGGVAYEDMAVLTRVNSTLLAVQVLLTEARIPCRAAVGPWILDRAGTAAALAYLRIASRPDRISRADVRATVRRPSRRISPKVADMLSRDAHTSLRSVRGLATWLEGTDAFAKEAGRVDGYADDIETLTAISEAPGVTTVSLLEAIRDKIGLGEAMDTLDASKGALDRSGNGDDLSALLQVAALHPDPATFEAWLRQRLEAESHTDGVHLATVHRVKGREWPCVAVYGADDGLFPHRLADDVEEERRIFHVALTRGRRQVVVVGDAQKPSPFLAELTQVAPPLPGPPGAAMPARAAAKPATKTKAKAAAAAADDALPAATGLSLIAGGQTGTITEIRRGEAGLAGAGGSATVEFGTTVRLEPGGDPLRLVAPAARVEAAVAALTAWRLALAKEEGKPPYVYLSNAHIRGIAERDPDTSARLARCPGIGPAKLEAYGDALLSLLDELA